MALPVNYLDAGKWNRWETKAFSGIFVAALAADRPRQRGAVALLAPAVALAAAVLASTPWELDPRSVVLIGVAVVAVAVDIAFLMTAPEGRTANLLLSALFGASIYAMYPVIIAHANDHAAEGAFIQTSGGLLMLYGFGAIAGPVVAAQVLQVFGTDFFFMYTSIIHIAFVAVTAWRMSARATPDMAAKKRYATLLRTSPFMYKLAHQRAAARSGKRPH